jgi:nucleoside-diphosphate-sugar epimerase
VAGEPRSDGHAPSGAVYNIGGGTEATLIDAIDICEGLTGRRLSIQQHAAAAGDPTRTTADTTRIREALNWKPATPLKEGLSAQLSWMEAKLSASGREGSVGELAAIGPGPGVSQREPA